MYDTVGAETLILRDGEKARAALFLRCVKQAASAVGTKPVDETRDVTAALRPFFVIHQ